MKMKKKKKKKNNKKKMVCYHYLLTSLSAAAVAVAAVVTDKTYFVIHITKEVFHFLDVFILHFGINFLWQGAGLHQNILGSNLSLAIHYCEVSYCLYQRTSIPPLSIFY
jgi:hypothetical protein